MCILLVEDEDFILEIMAESLTEAGFDVAKAHDGAEALRLAHADPGRFSALVSDVHMPGDVTGIEVAARLREQRPDLPVVIATGRPDVKAPAQMREAGFVFLRKPYLPSELVAILQHLVPGAGRAC